MPSRAHAMLFSIALLLQMAVPLMPATAADGDYVTMGPSLGGLLGGAIKRVTDVGCGAVELTPLACSDVVPVVEAGAMLGACVGLGAVTFGIGLGTCAAGVGLGAGLGAGIAAFQGQCHLDRRFWNECATNGFGAGKNLVEEIRKGDADLGDAAAAGLEFGLGMIPVSLGAGAAAKVGAKAASNAGGRAGADLGGKTLAELGGKAASRTTVAEVGLGSKVGEAFRSTGRFLTGGTSKVGDDIAKQGRTMREAAQRGAKGGPKLPSVEVPTRGFGGGKFGPGSTAKVKTSPPRGMLPRVKYAGGGAVEKFGKVWRVRPARLLGKSAVPLVGGPKIAQCVATCPPDSVDNDVAEDAFKNPPLPPTSSTSSGGPILACDSTDCSTTGNWNVRISVYEPERQFGTRYAFDEPVRIRFLIEAKEGVSKWSLMLANGRVDVKLAGDVYPTGQVEPEVARSFVLNSGDARLPPRSYAAGIAADDGQGHTASVALRFDVANEKGEVPEGSGGCGTDINFDGSSDCFDDLANDIAPIAGGKSANPLLVVLGILALLGTLGAVVWNMRRT